MAINIKVDSVCLPNEYFDCFKQISTVSNSKYSVSSINEGLMPWLMGVGKSIYANSTLKDVSGFLKNMQ